MTSKLIISLQKQNNGMFSSLNSRNINFERVFIPENTTEEEHLKLLQEENDKLKIVINENKPPQLPKQEKKKPVIQQAKDKISKNEDNDNEETYEDPIKKFDTITNMEEIKRAFFNGDYMFFEEQIKLHPLKFYKVNYKYDSDKDKMPDFSAKNLLKGFVRNFDDYRKYFMICFRCWKNKHEIKYKYESLWIVNTSESIQNVIGSLADDFDFIEETNIDEFINKIKKLHDIESDEPIWIDDYTCIGESYVH